MNDPLIIDYIDLIAPSGSYDDMSEIYETLRKLSKECNVTIVTAKARPPRKHIGWFPVDEDIQYAIDKLKTTS